MHSIKYSKTLPIPVRNMYKFYEVSTRTVQAGDFIIDRTSLRFNNILRNKLPLLFNKLNPTFKNLGNGSFKFFIKKALISQIPLTTDENQDT